MSELELIFSTLLRKDLEGAQQSHSLYLTYVSGGRYMKIHLIRYARLQFINF
jgi:hypothetical protein